MIMLIARIAINYRFQNLGGRRQLSQIDGAVCHNRGAGSSPKIFLGRRACGWRVIRVRWARTTWRGVACRRERAAGRGPPGVRRRVPAAGNVPLELCLARCCRAGRSAARPSRRVRLRDARAMVLAAMGGGRAGARRERCGPSGGACGARAAASCSGRCDRALSCPIAKGKDPGSKRISWIGSGLRNRHWTNGFRPRIDGFVASGHHQSKAGARLTKPRHEPLLLPQRVATRRQFLRL